jgi:ATP diphosphatase
MSDPGAKKTISDLIAVMAALRTPVTGCPWDLEQSYATIAPYTIEEAYEVADAIERGDRVDLAEELGDLLLQVVYHARLAEEEGAFAFADVADGITRKMVRRHPHVFGDAKARSAGMAKGMWETIKAEEKAETARRKAAATAASPPSEADRGASPVDAHASGVLADVPRALPALTRAIKLQEKAARVGFDWPSLGPVFDKMREELAELEAAASGRLGGREADAAIQPGAASSRLPARESDAAIQPGAASGRLPAGESDAAIQEEFGDLLFVMANVARHLKLDPEEALRRANAKFTRRFAYVEARLAAQQRSPEQSTLAEMDALWDEVRAQDKRARPPRDGDLDR